ncbi:MAG: hypothetical protein K0R40_4151, partial [Burkholderiales bacterium]|nr:hypothetical protein [Burkholderiales bacterium]
LTEGWARKLKAAYTRIDLMLAPHSASGPYPASFRNLSAAEKEAEARRLQTQYVAYWSEMAQILAPRLAAPCAAEYVVVGNLHEKNAHIGLAEAREAVADLRRRQRGDEPVRPVQLDCGSILDVDTGKLEGLPVRHPTEAERQEFILQHRDIPFDYHWEDSFTEVDIDALVRSARAGLWKKQQRLGWKADYNLYLTVDEVPCYAFNFAREGVEQLPKGWEARREPFLECFLPRPLLYQVLTRRAHWNNAEGGLHIDFFRRPNEYVPEVFTLLSFLQAE